VRRGPSTVAPGRTHIDITRGKGRAASRPACWDSGDDVTDTLIIFGLVLVAAGLLWPFLTKLGLGRLPGDIIIERENFRFYLPIATSLLISVVLSLLFWLLGR
jgi:hypothetical protein